MTAPGKTILATCIDAMLLGYLIFATGFAFLDGQQYAWIGAVLSALFLYRVTMSVIRLNNFINVTSEMLDTLALYIFDGDKKSVDKVLAIIVSNKDGGSVRDIINNAIRKTKSELPQDLS